jgi:UDP-N-acetylmuramoyl-L-alanyl-D-glutamate--2,6-diaminopimelate ligase
MEVSAHAIYFNKIGNIIFETGIFTNLTQDHLDFFNTFDKYKNVKASFFNSKHIKSAIINYDDPSAVDLCKNCNVPFVSYGYKNPSDIFAIDISQSIGGCSFIINLFDDIKEIKIRLLGEFNVSNALAAATTCKLLGIETEKIAEGLLNLKKVDGRLEYIGNFNGGDIFVDFAHTPDGLKKILESLKALNPSRLICLFGCGGNRDKIKRPLMGEIVGENADFCIITSDNPRYEDPLDIISDVETGLRRVTKKYVTIQERKSAIDYGIKLLTQGNILVIAGKGGENYQEIMGIKHIYNDNAVINEILQKLK